MLLSSYALHSGASAADALLVQALPDDALAAIARLAADGALETAISLSVNIQHADCDEECDCFDRGYEYAEWHAKDLDHMARDDARAEGRAEAVRECGDVLRTRVTNAFALGVRFAREQRAASSEQRAASSEQRAALRTRNSTRPPRRTSSNSRSMPVSRNHSRRSWRSRNEHARASQ